VKCHGYEKTKHGGPYSGSVLLSGDRAIFYTRWEYVDKGQFGVKCLWAMYPDYRLQTTDYRR